jgi:hypothetical protein
MHHAGPGEGCHIGEAVKWIAVLAAEPRPEAEAGVLGTDVEIGGVSPVLEP